MLVAALATCLRAGRTTTDDRNGDGRPDVWRTYDAEGRLAEVAVDSNFDGRTDVREIYAHGDLIRRESDRNFDDRVDLVEDFDPETHEHIRSTVDADFDGTADLLVMFRDDRPVYSSWAIDRPADPSPRRPLPVRTAATGGRGPILAWDDPFSRDANLRTPVAPSLLDDVALIDSAVVVERVDVTVMAAATSRLSRVGSPRPRAPSIAILRLRAPPLA